MKRLLKISLSVLLLALAFAVTQIPVETVTADTATVSTDADFQMNGTILVKYTGTAKTVSVPASVEIIGEEAFAGHTEIETVQFKGKNVTDILYRAFAGCTGIREFILPNSVEELGNGVFGDCTLLEKVEFGTGLKNLGIGTFANCLSLKTISIPKENTSFLFDDGCLYNSDKSVLYFMLPTRAKETYTMPSSVTDIAEYAFWNCANLKGIVLSSNLKEIPDYSFANCMSLNGITIPYSVNSIGIKAFSDCVNLVTAQIPASVSAIHETAFDGCGKLVISAEEGTVAYQYGEAFKEKNQAEYEDASHIVQLDPEEDAVNQEEATEKTSSDMGNVLASTYVVGNRAVLFIDNSKQSVYGNGNQADTDHQETIASLLNNALEKGTDIPKYKVAFGSIISDLAFYQKKDMTAYDFPDGITEIGEFAFARSNITQVNIPYGVTTIGYGAFYHCDYLREVSIPSTVTNIAPEAFNHTGWIKNWKKGTGDEDFLIVGDGILLAYRGDGGNIDIPENVKRIGPQVFLNNNTILSVNIPDSVIEIGEDAFKNCSNLATVTGGDYVRIIRDRAFSGCVLNSAHIGANVEYIGLASFDYSDANVGESSKVVVFDHMEQLPKPCYELTAERLSYADSRKNLLGDTVFAIVDKHIRVEDLKDTVLDLNGYGLHGVIAYISSHEKGIVTCLATSLTEEEFSHTYIPDSIVIDGKTYHVTGKEDISVFRQDRLVYNKDILLVNGSSVLPDVHDVVLEGNTGSFTLQIDDSDVAYQKINKGYKEVYKEALPENIVCIDIKLIDNDTGVPITKTGKQLLTMTVDLPDSISSGSIRILTVDRNGQLENVPYTRNDREVTFSVNHFSPFAFVNVSNESSVIARFTVSGENMDASPDTGDEIHPKWILSIGLIFMSIAVLFIKKKH